MSPDLLDDAAAAPRAAAMPPAELHALLHQAVPQLAAGVWSLSDARALRTLSRGSQRFTACHVSWVDHASDRPGAAELVVKEDRKRVPRWADRAARLLLAAGFGAGARSRVAVPYGVCEPGTLVSERVPGLSVLASLQAAPTAGACSAVAERAAAWLLDLQSAALDLPGSSRRGLPEALPQLVELAAVLDAGQGRRLGALARRLQAAALEVLDGPDATPVTSHGDLHPANLFVTSDALVAIDLDTVAAREPAYDVGYAVAHLLVTPLLAGVPLAHGRAAAGRFWDVYRRGGGAASDERVAVQAARALVQSLHFELVTYATGRTDLVELWAGGALALLEHGRAGLDRLPEQAAGDEVAAVRPAAS